MSLFWAESLRPNSSSSPWSRYSSTPDLSLLLCLLNPGPWPCLETFCLWCSSYDRLHLPDRPITISLSCFHLLHQSDKWPNTWLHGLCPRLPWPSMSCGKFSSYFRDPWFPRRIFSPTYNLACLFCKILYSFTSAWGFTHDLICAVDDHSDCWKSLNTSLHPTTRSVYTLDLVVLTCVKVNPKWVLQTPHLVIPIIPRFHGDDIILQTRLEVRIRSS